MEEIMKALDMLYEDIEPETKAELRFEPYHDVMIIDGHEEWFYIGD